MRKTWILGIVVFLVLAVLAPGAADPGQPAAGTYYNTVKQKLLEGKQVFGATLTTGDVEAAKKMAGSDYDYFWIEMQHSPMTYETAAALIKGLQGHPAVPFIRVPDATEGDIQKATDIGALGIIIPMVETVEKAQAAVRYAKYPPIGRRSTGSMQAPSLWGKDYRKTANDNVMVVVQIESPEGAANVEKIAAVPGVDVVFAASVDLANFTGLEIGNPKYEDLVTKIKDATLKAGKWLAGPGSWSKRPGYTFFQGRGAYKEI
jgi:2-keto-3-deoxy-L-rhamnonate aldolase RhmA